LLSYYSEALAEFQGVWDCEFLGSGNINKMIFEVIITHRFADFYIPGRSSYG
jgi:hypothetical protein